MPTKSPYTKLTAKQRAFVDEYLVDMNASAAARRAGYSKRTAHDIGHENLRKPKIAAAIAERQQARQERVEISQDRVVRELCALACSEHPGAVHRDDWEELPPRVRAAVKSVAWDPRTGAARSIVMHSKDGPLKMLGVHLGMASERQGLNLPLEALLRQVDGFTEEHLRRIANGESEESVLREVLR